MEVVWAKILVNVWYRFGYKKQLQQLRGDKHRGSEERL